MGILLIAIIIYLAIHHLVDIWFMKAKLNNTDQMLKNLHEQYRLLYEEVLETQDKEP